MRIPTSMHMSNDAFPRTSLRHLVGVQTRFDPSCGWSFVRLSPGYIREMHHSISFGEKTNRDGMLFTAFLERFIFALAGLFCGLALVGLSFYQGWYVLVTVEETTIVW